MPLSSNSIIHFTYEKTSLLGILAGGFKIHYCTEHFELGGQEFGAKVPMVSFCDIPLSEVKDHIEKYGHYGIGLTKEWAVRSGLNPVLYIKPKSQLSMSIGKIFNDFIDDSNVAKPGDSHRALLDLMRYTKNYQGNLIRSGTTTKNYRFSDEREWRYVPPFSSNCEMIAGEAEYEADKAKFDDSVSDMRLGFDPNDIKYIIIKDDAEITEFVDHLRRMKGRLCSYHDVERLATRLLTTEQIMTDV